MKAIVFWDTESNIENYRYWAIADYHNNGPWLFHWHENNQNWVTHRAADESDIESLQTLPHIKVLDKKFAPHFYAEFEKCGIETP